MRQSSSFSGAGALVAFLIFVLCWGITPIAYGHEANESEASWFNSLRNPNTGILCCLVHDCRAYDERTEVRIEGGLYAVLHNGIWLQVPASKIIERADNPTGHFVACVHDIGGYDAVVLCAVKGTST